MTELKDLILETVRSHAETARAAYESRNREVAVLKGQIQVLEHRVAELRAENIILRAELRKAGGIPSTDCLVAR